MEKAFPTEKECKGTHTNVKGGGSSKKKIVAFSNQIPKKRRMDAKHCVLCKQHGGMHNTHNTMECHKYEKDRTPKKPLQGKVHSTICTVEMIRMRIIIPMFNCLQKLQSLKNLTRN